jgi:hypothetical protein
VCFPAARSPAQRRRKPANARRPCPRGRPGDGPSRQQLTPRNTLAWRHRSAMGRPSSSQGLGWKGPAERAATAHEVEGRLERTVSVLIGNIPGSRKRPKEAGSAPRKRRPKNIGIFAMPSTSCGRVRISRWETWGLGHGWKLTSRGSLGTRLCFVIQGPRDTRPGLRRGLRPDALQCDIRPQGPASTVGTARTPSLFRYRDSLMQIHRERCLNVSEGEREITH